MAPKKNSKSVKRRAYSKTGKSKVAPAKAARAQKAVVKAAAQASPLARVSRGERRTHLDERLRSLYSRVDFIEKQMRELDLNRFFRCVIFGSARIKPDSNAYNNVFELARLLAGEGIDILTGGGPGLMEAANAGGKLGQQQKRSKSRSHGITIQLDFEPIPNSHLDVKRHHHRFSSRLDDFMRLSNIVVCTPGGIGTLLELYFTWQLIQVRHIERRPIILLDRSFWTGIIDWMKEIPLARGLISEKDFDFVSIVDTPEEAFALVSQEHKAFIARKTTT